MKRYGIVSPLELQTYLLDLPPLPREKIPGAIRARLRSLYPGDPDVARVDFYRNGDSAGAYLVFVSDNSVLDRYAEAGSTAVPPVSLFASFAENGNEPWIALFWTNEWMEAALMEGARILAVEAAPVGESPGESLLGLLNSFPGGLPLPSARVKLFYFPDRAPPAAVMAEALSAAGAKAAAAVGLDSERLGRLRHEYRLFSGPPRRGKFLKRVAIGLALLDLSLAAWTIRRTADREERYGAALGQTYETEKRDYAAAEEKRKELRRLMDEYALVAGRRPGAGYGTIAEIASRLGGGARIKSLSIQAGAFGVEAEGPDSLGAFTRIGESPAFEGVKLQNVLPSETGGEAFTLSGRLRDDRR